MVALAHSPDARRSAPGLGRRHRSDATRCRDEAPVAARGRRLFERAHTGPATRFDDIMKFMTQEEMGNFASDRRAVIRIIDRRFAVGAVVVDGVADALVLAKCACSASSKDRILAIGTSSRRSAGTLRRWPVSKRRWR